MSKSKTMYGTEADYLKIYTEMWCTFQNVPTACRPVFLELVRHMLYCDFYNLENSQLVYTGFPFADEIQEKLGIKKSMYQKHLKTLKDCGAIQHVNRGVYKINPSYAGCGAWKYDPREKHGGINDLIATFQIKDGTINTEFVWAEDEIE